MDNFTFENTTRIHFGEGQIAQIAKEIPQDEKILVLYGGGSIKKNGVYDQVKEALKDHNWSELGGIEPNPQYDTLMKAVEKIKAENFTYLLAVGGGSVVDGTKFIAAASCFEGEPWDICEKQAEVKEALALSCVLTLPATGSETNIGAVVSRGNIKLHFHSHLVRPEFAILDPATTLSLSPRQTSNGVIDAFVHVMEQYLTYPVNAQIQDRFSESILATLIEEGPKALENPDSIETRANIMWAATLGLNGLISVGVPVDWATHMIGHEITGNYKIDHGRTLSIILPAIMKIKRQQKQDKILQYGERIFEIKEGSVDEKIDKAISKTVEFFKQMNMPVSFKDIELDEKAIEPILKTLEANGRIALGEHGDIDISVSRKILETAL